jgi:hypothetical protein
LNRVLGTPFAFLMAEAKDVIFDCEHIAWLSGSFCEQRVFQQPQPISFKVGVLCI